MNNIGHIDFDDFLIIFKYDYFDSLEISLLSGLGLPEEDSNWWINTHYIIRSSNIHNDSKTIFLSKILDLMIYLHEPIRKNPALFSKIIINNLTQYFSIKEIIYLLLYRSKDISQFINEINVKKYPWNYIKMIVEKYKDSNQYHPCITFCELISLNPHESLSNVNELDVICDSVIRDNPQSVIDYKKGKLNSINHLKGQVMKLTKGKADASIIHEIFKQKLVS